MHIIIYPLSQLQHTHTLSHINRWIPLVSPIFGTLTGGLLWELLIGEPRGLVEGYAWTLQSGEEDEQHEPIIDQGVNQVERNGRLAM